MEAPSYQPEIIRLWPGAAPGSGKLTFQEKITERSRDPDRPNRIYTSIVTPSLMVHRPAVANGAAVIIAPGGAYERIVIDKEGPDTAAWLNRLGITAFILKYRLPNEGHENGSDVPLQDAQRAVRLIRTRAAEWSLDPNRIGFLGYSAGGHLAATVSFFAGKRVYAPVDAADEFSARPDFTILGYPLTGAGIVIPASLDRLTPLERMICEYRFEPQSGATYPPTFLFHADDDPVVSVRDSISIHAALHEARTPVELHVFRRGGHGFGIRAAQGPIAQWPELCAAWLRDLGILPTAGPAPQVRQTGG